MLCAKYNLQSERTFETPFRSYVYISSRIYENRTSGLLGAKHLTLTQLK